MFKIGEEVVCVRGSQDNEMLVIAMGGSHVFAGMHYHIRGIGSFGGLYLEEIHNPLGIFFGEEIGYQPDRFRPIKKVETNISAFTEMLDRVPEPV